MSQIFLPRSVALRRTALAACFTLMFAGVADAGLAKPRSKPVASHKAHGIAQTIDVTTCEDAGLGSLRDAIAGAGPDDTINLATVPTDCSIITLKTGAIQIGVDGLKIVGPGQDALAIDGGGADRVFNSDYGLAISDVTITNGVDPSGAGGCVLALGDLVVERTALSNCRAGSDSVPYASGGALATNGNLTLSSSSIESSSVVGHETATGGAAYAHGNASIVDSLLSGNATVSMVSQSAGGAAWILGNATIDRSVLTSNSASSTNGIALGGAVGSFGDIAVKHSVLSNNSTSSENEMAGGGAVFGGGAGEIVVSERSIISHNSAYSENAASAGGGILDGTTGNPGGTITLFDSRLVDNTASANCASCSTFGGGAAGFASIAAVNSTISGNHAVVPESSTASAAGGGLATRRAGNYGGIGLTNSTVSGNSAIGSTTGGGLGGGIAATLDSPFIVSNSTIAFNHATTFGGGMVASANAGTSPRLNSSVVAHNEAPIGADIAPSLLSDPFTVEGSHNLVMTENVDVTLPDDTLHDDPMLLQLGNHGGPTFVHPLADCSPAIDAGSNDDALTLDQRGAPFVREFGTQADIGAFESQPFADRITYGDFELDPCNP